MNVLRGKTAFVTGAASGIGLGIARACHEHGMSVVLADIDADKVEAAAGEIDEDRTSVLSLALDIRDPAQWQHAADRAEARFGAVHLLCNNAGISPSFKPVEAIEARAWELMLQVNLTGAFLGVQCMVPRMKARGGWNHIVNTASMCGIIPQPGMADYDAAKFAIVGLSEALRAELAPAGIGVSVLCPGPVRSQLWRSSLKVRGLPDVDTPPAASRAGSASPTALDPFWVGRRVVRGVMDNEMYIFTHPERAQEVEGRFGEILAGFRATEAYLKHDSPVR